MTRPVALVTGARRGIGAAIALELARQGHNLVLTDLEVDASADSMVEACQSLGARAVFIAHNSTDIDAHDGLIARIYQHYGRLDVVVNSAGIGSPARGDLLDLLPENYDLVMNVNLRGAVFLCQSAARRMVKVRSEAPRSFILITSVSADVVSPERAEYCMSKAGLSMFAKALALRLAPENIAVFEVRPGIIKTDMTAGVSGKYDLQIAEGLVPMRRWGTPEDTALCVAGLASGAFQFATGSIIQAGGGLSIQKL